MTWLFTRAALIGFALLASAAPVSAQAQALNVTASEKSQPVTFTADTVQYDRDHGLVTATGRVEAWQNNHQLRADKVTFDRNTNVVAATGHVELIDPDGQAVFSDYAELTAGLKDGVLRGMRAILAQNGKLVANGARRTGGQLNELTKVIYTTCNLCKAHPQRAPLWDLRARSAVQDIANKRIEYRDAVLDMFGIPVFYMPYFFHADPSVKRASGFLVPSLGTSKHLGFFLAVPYYWAIGPSSDATFVPFVGSKTGPQLDTVYRRRFNSGSVRVDASAANDQRAFQGHVFAKGEFSYNNTWRAGFDINLATSENYLRDFRIANAGGNVLQSSLYIEGFGEGGYAKLSTLAYQGINSTVTDSLLPFVLPRYQYSYFGLPDAWGGRLSLDSNDFNVVRRVGTNDERVNLSGQWERPGIGAFGDVWSLTARVETAAYNAYSLNQEPNYASVGQTTTARVQPTVALKLAWPLVRITDGGSELIEPIVQLIAAPNTGGSTYARVPNEDALTPEFTDATLFSLNRFQGIDRQEGGLRANIGLHGTWTTRHGVFDGLIGQAYHLHADDSFLPDVGLGRQVSDIVSRISYTPSPLFDITARTRLDHRNFDVHYGEAVVNVGPPILRVGAGYLYTLNTPYFYDLVPAQGDPGTPRNELSLSASTKYGYYRLSGYARRDLHGGQLDNLGGEAAYEDECYIFDVRFDRRYTSINHDNGDSTVLFEITLKTVGEFGFHAL